MQSDIVDFLSNNFVLTLSTFDGKNPYSAPLFYLFLNNVIFFLSDLNTNHSQHILKFPTVSASIFRYTRIVKEIQGVQLIGICKFLEHTQDITENSIFIYENHRLNLKNIYDKYCEQFPEAKEIPSSLWGIFPYWIKFTNNRVRFGHKTIWRYEDDISS
jgi:hypothetical protein